MVGPPEPIIEALEVPKISAAEARRGQEKRAFNDGRPEVAVSREAQAMHEAIHTISRSGGKELAVPKRGSRNGGKRRRS